MIFRPDEAACPRQPARPMWPCGVGCAWGVASTASAQTVRPSWRWRRSLTHHPSSCQAIKRQNVAPTWTCPCLEALLIEESDLPQPLSLGRDVERLGLSHRPSLALSSLQPSLWLALQCGTSLRWCVPCGLCLLRVGRSSFSPQTWQSAPPHR